MNNRLRNRWIKRLFPFFALLLLLPWPVAYAFDVNDATAAQDTVRIEVPEESLKPAWTAFGRAIGGVTTPGDLFYIDATGNTADIMVTLHLTNARELIKSYRYMALNVGVYVERDGEWEVAAGSDGELIADSFITMRNGQVTFLLPGYASYKLTIDDGVFYCTNAGTDGLSPDFYLEVD